MAGLREGASEKPAPADALVGVRTTRTSATTVETVLEGRISAAMIAAAATSYRKLGGRARWVIVAEAARSYAPDAVEQAVKDFGELHREHGLDTIVMVITAPLVRMSTSIVSASLRALGSRLSLRAVDKREAVEAELAR